MAWFILAVVALHLTMLAAAQELEAMAAALQRKITAQQTLAVAAEAQEQHQFKALAVLALLS